MHSASGACVVVHVTRNPIVHVNFLSCLVRMMIRDCFVMKSHLVQYVSTHQEQVKIHVLLEFSVAVLSFSQDHSMWTCLLLVLLIALSLSG